MTAWFKIKGLRFFLRNSSILQEIICFEKTTNYKLNYRNLSRLFTSLSSFHIPLVANSRNIGIAKENMEVREIAPAMNVFMRAKYNTRYRIESRIQTIVIRNCTFRSLNKKIVIKAARPSMAATMVSNISEEAFKINRCCWLLMILVPV